MSTFGAAFEIAEFFAGTTEETTTLRTCRFPRNPATTLLESLLVAIRTGAETRLTDANANFAYELLISTNK
jgi:hypothetical protein